MALKLMIPGSYSVIDNVIVQASHIVINNGIDNVIVQASHIIN